MIDPWSLGGTILLAILSWSFTEYAMHNWYGHLANGSNEFSREHLRHHALAHYFAPAWKKVVGSVITMTILCSLSAILVDLVLAATFSFSFAAAGLSYEWLHYTAHFKAPKTRYGRWRRHHHFYHHFNQPKYNHGVTSPLWDHIFGTYRPVDKVRVPAKKAMPWLINPETKQVYPKYQADYVLLPGRNAA